MGVRGLEIFIPIFGRVCYDGQIYLLHLPRQWAAYQQRPSMTKCFCESEKLRPHRVSALRLPLGRQLYQCVWVGQSCLTLCDPIDGSHQPPLSLGFSRQEHWSGLPFPSPMLESEKWKWSRSVVSDSSDPMDCSLPGSSIHGIFQARVLEWGAIAFSARPSSLP